MQIGFNCFLTVLLQINHHLQCDFQLVLLSHRYTLLQNVLSPKFLFSPFMIVYLPTGVTLQQEPVTLDRA